MAFIRLSRFSEATEGFVIPCGIGKRIRKYPAVPSDYGPFDKVLQFLHIAGPALNSLMLR
jgi:hypothetical protein